MNKLDRSARGPGRGLRDLLRKGLLAARAAAAGSAYEFVVSGKYQTAPMDIPGCDWWRANRRQEKVSTSQKTVSRSSPGAVACFRMKEISRLLQLASSLLFLAGSSSLGTVQAQPASTNAVWEAPARAARRPNPFPADAKSLVQGKELYAAACLPCHGPAGKGDGPAAATLERNGVRVRPGDLSDPKRWKETDGALFWKLTEGKTPMPAWAETLSEEQRWLIVNYIRTLAPKPDNNQAIAKTGGN